MKSRKPRAAGEPPAPSPGTGPPGTMPLPVRQVLQTPRPQPKLTVSRPDDASEREAEQVADHVMRLPARDAGRDTDLQHAGDRPDGRATSGEIRRWRTEPLRTSSQGLGPNRTVPEPLAARLSALAGGGQPLPPGVRSYFEPRFGRDLGDVRLHTDPAAGQLARSVDARAFTLGKSIVFGPGEYAPGSMAGRHLIAHELTHVLQQRKHASRHVPPSETPLPTDVVAPTVLVPFGGGDVQVRRQAPQVQTPPRRGLEQRYNGNFEAAITAVANRWGGVGGVVTRQRDAVQEFVGPGGASVQDPPSLAEQILQTGIGMVLDFALKGIGSAIVRRVSGRVRTYALAAAIAGEVSGTAPAGVVELAARSANAVVARTVGAGRARARAGILSSFSASRALGTPLARFGRVQLDVLNDAALAQFDRIVEELSAAPAEARWAVAEALYESLGEELQHAYRTQWSHMTDVWFTMQTQSVGLGARRGVLRVDLANAYAHERALRVQQANLLGAGSNEGIRSAIADRPLATIGIPKVVHMRSGSLGRGILDHQWWFKVYGPEPPSRGPVIRAAGPDPLRAYLGGPQRVVEITGNRWGPTWLAAYHLRLRDLDRTDPRAGPENVWAGAREIWAALEERSVAQLGGSVIASEW
jgi:hypothetical protein